MSSDEMQLFCAPTEPSALKKLGNVTLMPERWGVDFLWNVGDEMYGVQRKEVKDLMASAQDGRLGKELDQMQPLAWKALLVEGKVEWSLDGEMLGKQWGRQWSRSRWEGLLLHVQSRGCWICHSSGVDDSAVMLRLLYTWSQKEHTKLPTRSQVASSWGSTPSNRDYQIHLLTGLPGISTTLAERLLDKFGMPFMWSISEADLMTVEGIGKKKAQSIYRSLGRE